jgi:hypothetical protein
MRSKGSNNALKCNYLNMNTRIYKEMTSNLNYYHLSRHTSKQSRIEMQDFDMFLFL